MPDGRSEQRAGGRQLVSTVALMLTTQACDSTDSPEHGNAALPAPTALSAPPSPNPPKVRHNYVEREGDTYLYVTTVTDEDEAKGRAVGDVVMYRYLGEKVGMHVLQGIDEGGRAFSKAECSEPCRVIRRTVGSNVDRLPFDASSVIGSAFEDAISGRLKMASRPSATRRSQLAEQPVIPAPFVGEWNQDLAHCGTGLNDSRLQIEPRKVRFYESDAAVNKVTVEGERAVTVEGSFVGEGEVWKDSLRMVLSRSGDGLTIDGITRQRCPKSR